MALILIIEDEVELAKVLQSYLEKAGYQVLHAARGDAGLALWRQQHPDLVLLDLNLPGMDGLDVATAIRRQGETALIMVTARVDEVDRMLGLELGADDYITKPYSPREVVARVKTVLRRVLRADQNTSETLKIADLCIDPDAHSLTQNGRRLELTPTEFTILLTLARQPGRVFSRLQLLEASQGMAYEGYERSIDAHVKNLRAKLQDDSKDQRYVETVFGIGYRFKKA